MIGRPDPLFAVSNASKNASEKRKSFVLTLHPMAKKRRPTQKKSLKKLKIELVGVSEVGEALSLL